MKTSLLPALSICIIVITLLSSCTTDKNIHRSELGFVVAPDPEDPSRKCIIGTYHGTDGMAHHYIEKIVPEFESDLTIGTPVRAWKKECSDCATQIRSKIYTDDAIPWNSRSVAYKIVARPFPSDT